MYNRIYEGYKPLNPEREEFVLQNQAALQINSLNITNNTEINNKYTELYPQMRFIQSPKYRIHANFRPEVEEISTKLAENIKEAIWECQRNKTYTQQAYEKCIERYLINNPKVTVISHGVIQKIDQYGNPWKEWYDDKSIFDEHGLVQQPSLNYIPIQGTVYAKFVPLKIIEQLTEDSSNETLDKVLSIGAILLGAAVLVVATVATAGAAGAMAGTIAASYGFSAATATAAATGLGYGIAGFTTIDAINSSVEVATGTNYIAKGLYNAFGNENTTEQDFINGYRNVSDFVHMAGWTYVTFGTYAMGSGYGSQNNTDTSGTKTNALTKMSSRKSVISSGKPSGNYSGADNIAEAARLKEYYKQAEKYGTGSIKELQNGRIRFYEKLKPARMQGEMAGSRHVREWNPYTGYKRDWYETLDYNGNIRQVRPDPNITGGRKVHYMFDADGNYKGNW